MPEQTVEATVLSQLPLVLIIDSGDLSQRFWKRRLEGHCRVLFASTLTEANELFGTHVDELAAISIASRIPPKHKQAIDVSLVVGLIREMKSRFGDRPLIASTIDPECQREFMAAGCTIASPEKLRLHHVIRTSLGLSSQ